MPRLEASKFDSSSLTRRTLLSVGAAVGLTGALAGCSNAGRGGTSGSNDAESKAKVRPTHVRYNGVKPDFSGAEYNIPDAFNEYPTDPVDAIAKAPGDGKPILGMTYINGSIPPKLSRNKFWQELNKRIGSPLELNLTPSVDYNKKFATAVAGDALGDIFMVGDVPQRPQMLAAKAVDLTPHLAGDKIKKYPFLANLEDTAWNSAIFNGKIYAIPIPRGAISSQVLYARKDILDSQGLSAEVKSADEFVTLCKELTNGRKNRFALADVPDQYVQNMYNVPNEWSLQDDKLVSKWENPAQENCLKLLRQLWKSGYIHPEAFTGNNQDRKIRFGNGTSPLVFASLTGWGAYLTAMGDEGELTTMGPPAYDGNGEGHTWLGAPTISITSISKKAEDRVETMLAFLDFLATPFGTSEYLFRHYGIPGVDYKMVDQNPVKSERGKSEAHLALGYLADAPWAIYLPQRKGASEACFDAVKKYCPSALKNPVAGMYSETESRSGVQIGGDITDVRNNIIQGRQPLSDWAPAVKKWKTGGGDKIAEELYSAYQLSH